MLFMLSFIVPMSGCDDREIVVQGVVLSQDGVSPAANARAIVTVYNNKLKSTKIARYGLTADSEGRLNTTLNAPFHVTDVTIQICTVNNVYAVNKQLSPDFTVTAGEVPERYQKMYQNSIGKPWMNYNTFNGALELHLRKPVTFIGNRWKAHRGEPKKY